MLLNKKHFCISFTFILILLGCSSISKIEESIPPNEIAANNTYKILSLGDSYTIGTSVCDTCRFPEQLVDSLSKNTDNSFSFPLKIIAKNGWTTSNLINAIESENIERDYNLVTLLIGVNNQFQNRNFQIYESEFSRLIDFAVSSVGGNLEKLIVLSIPDYAFTPFGRGNATISAGIKKYNDFAKAYCESRDVTFLNITDITKEGLVNPTYVASDGLHPSKEAYSKFVERLLPIALKKLKLLN